LQGFSTKGGSMNNKPEIKYKDIYAATTYYDNIKEALKHMTKSPETKLNTTYKQNTNPLNRFLNHFLTQAFFYACCIAFALLATYILTGFYLYGQVFTISEPNPTIALIELTMALSFCFISGLKMSQENKEEKA
jgi:hypothetical protein